MSRKKMPPNQNLTLEQQQALQVMHDEISPSMAALLIAAFLKAYESAYSDSLREPNTELAKQAFSSALPHAINRQIHEIIWPKGEKVRVRIAFNRTHTNVFIFIDTGRVKFTAAKTKSPGKLPPARAYRRAVVEGERIELLYPSEDVYTRAEDVIGVLHYGHDFEFGVPSEPSFVRISRLEDKGQKYGPYLDVLEMSRGHRARVLEAPVTQTLIAVGQNSSDAVEPRIGQIKRKRGEQIKKPDPTEDKEKKTS